MKKTIVLGFALLLAVAFVMPAAAGDVLFDAYWAVSNTGDATGPAGVYLAFAGVPAKGNEVPMIEGMNVTSDLSTSTMTVYVGNGTTGTVAASDSYSGENASGQKIVCTAAATTDFSGTAGAGSWVAIADWTNQKFEINRISSKTSTDSLNMVRNLVNTYAAGSIIYELDAGQSAIVGNTTKDWGTVKMYGKRGYPMGIVVNGTSACSINGAWGAYK